MAEITNYDDYWQGIKDVAQTIEDILNTHDKIIDMLGSRQALGILLSGIRQDIEANGR